MRSWRRLAAPAVPHAASLLALAFIATACSEPAPRACPPGANGAASADNALDGRWSSDGEHPALAEEWRLAVPVRLSSSAAATARVDRRGVIRIADPEKGRFVEVDPTRRDPVAEHPIPEPLLAALLDSRVDARLPLPGIHPLPSGDVLAVLSPGSIAGGAAERRLSLVVRMTPDAGVLDTVYSVSTSVLNDHGFFEWPRPGTRVPLVAVGPGGAVALAGASSLYRIDLLGADLADSLAVCRTAPALPLTTTETGAAEIPGSPPGLARLLDRSRKIKPVVPFGRIFLGAEGRLWVQRERPDPQRIYAHPGGAAYDVFAAGGAYLGEVRAPGGSLLIGDSRGLVYGLEFRGDGFWDLVAYELS